MKKKLLLVAPILIGIDLILFLGGGSILGIFDRREEIIPSSILTDTIDISELSTAQFIYNGIAEILS